MNYQKLYNQIISKRKFNPLIGIYTENHHIIPKSLGGSDDSNNLVRLSAREHFICHYLLAKIYDKYTVEWYKMNHAFMIMKLENLHQDRYVNSRLYEYLKSNFSNVMSNLQQGDKNSQYGTKWIYNEQNKISRKIPKDDVLPTGWKLGRYSYKKPTYNTCNSCGIEYQVKTKEIYCSKKCRLEKNQASYVGREEEFLFLYNQNKSMNKTLKLMGYKGAVSDYYRWAKSLI